MKLYFNMGFNFQSALFMQDLSDKHMKYYHYIIDFNKPLRDKVKYPSRGYSENLKFFERIKKL